MPFQEFVRQFATSGLPGEVANFGPERAKSWILQSNGSNSSTNPIGYAYTWLAEGIATPGGLGAFLGILIRPKEYALQGNASGTLAPTYYLRDNENGELSTTDELWITTETVLAVGESISYEVATGALGGALTWVPDGATYIAVPTAIAIEQTITVAPGTAKIRLTY